MSSGTSFSTAPPLPQRLRARSSQVEDWLAPASHTRPTAPRYRVAILGAGRSLRGGLPSAMADVGHGGSVLDWLLSAFSALPCADVHFVSGYMAQALMDRYRGLQFVFNPRWETTGPARSLALAPLASTVCTYVSYADVVFRPETVARMEMRDADLVVAIDRRWRDRYEGRSTAELDAAEKVACHGDRITDIGKHVPTAEATAEFAGLIRLSAATACRLQNVMASGIFMDSDGLPEVVRFLIDNGVAVATVDVDGQWAELNAPQDLARFVLGTKAESLERLRPLVRAGRIGELVCFTHAEWTADQAAVISRIQSTFGDASLIVRSSALSEDTWRQSCAGACKSVPDVLAKCETRLASAVEEVFASYPDRRPENQVLVQEMLTGVTMSGVIMTRTPALGAPYYVINYDNTSARTDTVTGGHGQSLRTLYVHRGSELRPGLPDELYRLMDVVGEVEKLVGHDSLDIEFAFTGDGHAHVLQVRPIASAPATRPPDDARLSDGIKDAARFLGELQQAPPFVVGASTRLSVMSDWNPAEIIGTKPGRLAFSLYRYLITDETWARQRAEYGYRDVRPCNLIVDVLGHPYVDVRATFNSFIPASLPDALAARLVEYYLEELSGHPALHDKVEFDVLITCLGFDFDKRAVSLREAGFSAREIGLLREALRRITRNGMARCERDLAALAEAQRRFDRIRRAVLTPLERAFVLLEDARQHGVLAFAHLARGAFVATSLLRSLAAAATITPEQAEALLASVRTVSGDMNRDARLVVQGTLSWEAFVARYGHLRPGTYDITSPHYGSAPEEFLRPVLESARQTEAADSHDAAPWDCDTRDAISRALEALGLDTDADGFEHFCRQAIAGREYGKFVFTRNLSAALEALVEFGSAHFVSRDELAAVRIEELFALRAATAENVSRRLKQLAAEGHETSSLTQAVCLPDQIVCQADLVCFEQAPATPNFITRGKVRASIVALSHKTAPGADLAGRIVLVPNADPGFDWIFSRDIAGLITMYGGANSHMAVRAAEFGLPAATGVGALLYRQINNARIVELDCASRQIRIVR